MWSTLIRVYLRGRNRSAPRGRRRPPPLLPALAAAFRCRRAISRLCGRLPRSLHRTRAAQRTGAAREAHDSGAPSVPSRVAGGGEACRDTPGAGRNVSLEGDVVRRTRSHRLRLLEVRGISGNVRARRDRVALGGCAGVAAAQELDGVGDDRDALALVAILRLPLAPVETTIDRDRPALR